MLKRKTCRKFYRELRDRLSREQVSAKSQLICEQLLASDEFRAAETIFAYYPLGNEVDCLSVLKQALTAGKRVVLPRTEQDSRMDFYEITGMDDVEEGTFHVMEPKVHCRRFEPVADSREMCQNMLVIVPGVVFDCVGNRYGYGKGYYDRYFARFPHLKRMALVYTEQMSKEPLECLETDVKMHVILTEEGRIDII